MKKKLLTQLQVQETLIAKNILIFTRAEFSRIFHLASDQGKYFIERFTAQGLFLRLKKGLYALKTHLPGEQEIANVVYRPSYLSFEYALSYYHLIPEASYVVTSATTKPTRNFEVDNRSFHYLTIKRTAFAGYQAKQIGGRTILLAEPEKAVVDYLYFTCLGRKSFNDRLNIASLNRTTLLQYAELYQRPKLLALILKLYAK